MTPSKQDIGNAVTAALKILLSEKHLYQCVELDLVEAAGKAVEYAANRSASERGATPLMSPPKVPSLADAIKTASQFSTDFWNPVDALSLGNGYRFNELDNKSTTIPFALPTINTFCLECEERWPFNPVFDSCQSVQGSRGHQWFYLGYQCQQCKTMPVRFLVRREGFKLRLAGRDPIEFIPTPKVLPKGPAKYFSAAVIAHHAGQTLAGLFLLRVFIEQFWRTLPAVQELLKNEPRATGEKHGDAYQKTLPDDFKERFPSLKECYGRLSEAIHSADANAITFVDVSARIVEHFDARRLFKIV